MGNRAQIRPRAASHPHCGFGSAEREDRQLVHGHFDRRDLHRLLLSRGHICRPPADLLGRDGRRSLQKGASKTIQRRLDFALRQFGLAYGAGCLAIGVVTVRGPAETDHPFVCLLVAGKELRKPGRTVQHQWQHTGSHGIQRAQMSDFTGVRDAPHLADHIV